VVKILLLSLCGISAGFLNGLLGTGGGIVLVFGLGSLIGKDDKKEVYTLTLAVCLLLSLLSAVSYAMNGGLSIGKGMRYALPAGIGGGIGAMLLDRLPTEAVGKIFGLLVVIAGANMAGLFGW